MNQKEAEQQEIVVREARPGEASLTAHFYYKIFEQQFQFVPATEQYFLHAAAELFDDPEGSRLWVAVADGKIKGSVCVVNKGGGEAQLRLFGMDASLQGRGIGKELMQRALDFCAEKHYGHLVLWTIDICKAARHLYAQLGFAPTESKPNDTWAHYHMTEEKWERRS